jgi:4-hydroxybenzoate polyprenyltransferase
MSSYHAGRMLRDLIRLARPRDWTKSVFVLLPLPFAWRAGAHFSVRDVALGVFAFCLTASAVYVLNDLRDAAADRAHPHKRQRPIASGAIAPGVAVPFALLLLAVGFALAWATGHPRVLVYLALYVATNAVYTLGGKQAPILDVFLLASGFVLRVLTGCALVDAAPSNWLLTCSLWVALFLGFAKRRADFARGMGAETVPTRIGYSASFLDHAMSIAAGVTLMSYVLYSLEATVFVPGRELAGMPFVAFGLLHYLRLAHMDEVRISPVEMAWRSRAIQVCSLGWMIATLWSLGVF